MDLPIHIHPAKVTASLPSEYVEKSAIPTDTPTKDLSDINKLQAGIASSKNHFEELTLRYHQAARQHAEETDARRAEDRIACTQAFADSGHEYPDAVVKIVLEEVVALVVRAEEAAKRRDAAETEACVVVGEELLEQVDAMLKKLKGLVESYARAS